MYDYIEYDYGMIDSVFAAMFGGAYLSMVSIYTILCLVGMWRMFTKAGQAGWKSLIPIYNFWVSFEIAGKPGWYALLLWVPILNVILLIFMYINIAKAFGKSGLYALGLLLLNPIFTIILGFDNSVYDKNNI